MVQVRLSEPMLVGELRNLLAGMLDADVRETRNELEIEFRPSSSLDSGAQLLKVERLAWAWRAAGHVDVRTQVALG
jgi:hypothetical protein